MSVGPLDRPADVQSLLPIQVLCALGGMFLVFVEGSLAHWSIFHSSTPLVALCYIYFMQIAYPFRLSLLAVLFMGLFSEIMFYHMLGTNCTAFIVAALVTQWRASVLRDADFIEIWANFSLIAILTGVIKILVYFISYFSIPDMSSLLQQIGMTALLFPVCYVVLVSVSSVMTKITAFETR
jgi:cell shape-determining protein MreD